MEMKYLSVKKNSLCIYVVHSDKCKKEILQKNILLRSTLKNNNKKR